LHIVENLESLERQNRKKKNKTKSLVWSFLSPLFEKQNIVKAEYQLELDVKQIFFG